MSEWTEIFDQTEAAEQREQKFETIPAGEYTGFIVSAKLNETKAPAKVSVQWRLVDEGSKYANRNVFSNYSMNEKGIPFLKQDLRTLGCDIKKSTELPAALESLEARTAKIYVKPREFEGKTYYTVYVREHLSAEYVEKAFGSKGFDASEEITF